MSEQLLPCPFCGASPDLVIHKDSEEFWVECTECECSTGYCNSETIARSSWNRRAPSAGQQQQEPVATVSRPYNNGEFCVVQWHRTDIPDGAKLYTHQQPQAQGEPERLKLLALIRGSQYGLQFGDGSLRKGRSLTKTEMQTIKNALEQPQAQGEPDAWMTDDGRLMSAESKRSTINSSADAFVIPLYKQPRAAVPDGWKLWLWQNGDHFWAFEHLYPCSTPGGDPMTLGEPVGYAIFKHSHDRGGAQGGEG